MDSFNFNTTTVNFAHSVPEYSWGESDDIEHKSVINGKRTFVTMGDHATVTYTVYMYKLDSAGQTAINSCRGKEGTLTTAVGSGTFRCTQIKKDFLDPIAGDKLIAILTFKSLNYV